MAASKMTAKRLNALENAVRAASREWTSFARDIEPESPSVAASFRERAAQAQAGLEVVKERFNR